MCDYHSIVLFSYFLIARERERERERQRERERALQGVLKFICAERTKRYTATREVNRTAPKKGHVNKMRPWEDNIKAPGSGHLQN